MRILLVADVHANIEAFQAVVDNARSRGDVEAIWCLGDVVGYGPDPVACIELLQGLPHEAIVGNHDLAAAGAIGVEEFNHYAAAAALWTQQQLPEEMKAWLTDLPRVRVLEDLEITLTHGSLIDPVWDYLLHPEDAMAHLAEQTTPSCFVGHTHLPQVYYDAPPRLTGEVIRDGHSLELGQRRFVANPGSVGQPRNGDPRAAFAIVDTTAKVVAFHRVEYDIAATQAKMRAAGLPDFLVQRLARGR
jgi:diadenosine tetraphosphatase ApaH/serine/threonine PP2A family protein phosphatase